MDGKSDQKTHEAWEREVELGKVIFYGTVALSIWFFYWFVGIQCPCWRTGGRMRLIGRMIPDGVYQAFHQGDIRSIDLGIYRGGWLVLVFYPGDVTFVCPTELAELADLYPSFRALGAEVISVSTDSVYVHKAWHETSPTIGRITYPMLADPTGRLCRELSVCADEEGVALRASFIVDPDGLIRAYEVHDNSIGRSMQELLRKLQAAAYVREHGGQEVCPAGWRPGAQALKPSLDLVGKL